MACQASRDGVWRRSCNCQVTSMEQQFMKTIRSVPPRLFSRIFRYPYNATSAVVLSKYLIAKRSSRLAQPWAKGSHHLCSFNGTWSSSDCSHQSLRSCMRRGIKMLSVRGFLRMQLTLQDIQFHLPASAYTKASLCRHTNTLRFTTAAEP